MGATPRYYSVVCLTMANLETFWHELLLLISIRGVIHFISMFARISRGYCLDRIIIRILLRSSKALPLSRYQPSS